MFCTMPGIQLNRTIQWYKLDWLINSLALFRFRERNARVRCRNGDQEVVSCIIDTFLYKTTQTSQNTPLQTVFNEAERRSYLNKCRAGLAWLVLTDENTRRLSL